MRCHIYLQTIKDIRRYYIHYMSLHQCYMFDFTLKYEESINGDYRKIKSLLKQKCKKGIFQLEKSSGGYFHWQGRISLIRKTRLVALISFFKNIDFMNKIHLSCTNAETAYNQNFEYVTKTESRVEGPYDINYTEPELTRQLLMFNSWDLFPWQKKLKSLALEFNLRKIDIIYNPRGNEGKSLFSEHMEYVGIAEEVPPYRLMDDIFQWVCCRPTKPCYILDMPRGMKKDKLGDLYSGIEIIKNGVAYDKRNRARKIRFDRPRIFVFTNTLPCFALMSKDRWNIWYINDTNELIEFKLPNNENILFSSSDEE